MKVKSLSRVRLLGTPWTAAHQAPPSLGFSRREYWSRCHFLLQCMKVKSESEVAQSCPTPRDPMDCSPPGSSVPGIFQVRALERVPLHSPPGSSVPGIFQARALERVPLHSLPGSSVPGIFQARALEQVPLQIISNDSVVKVLCVFLEPRLSFETHILWLDNFFSKVLHGQRRVRT